MNIQRYDPAVHDDRDEHGVNYFAEMEPDPSGEWVRFSDVHAVLAKFAAFADEKGEPMKAILTADGKLITQASPVWWWDGNVLLEGVASMSFNIVFSDPNVPAMLFTPNAGIGGVYSTKQAAEDAAGVKP